MSKERFQRTGMSSFYGEFFYDAVVPRDDFLRMLGQVVPWQRFTYKLLKYYKGKAQVGRPPLAYVAQATALGPLLLLSLLGSLSVGRNWRGII